MKKFLADWIFPLIAFFMFTTMFIAVMVKQGPGSLEIKYVIAYAASIMPYTLMLTSMYIVARPRFIEKHVGMPKMYEVHAIMTVLTFILVAINVSIFWQGFDAMFRSVGTIAGYIGFLAITVGMLSGMLSLSGMFVNNNKFFRNLKERVLNREVMLWVHRIAAIVAVFATFTHQMSLVFLRTNIAFVILSATYLTLTMGYYTIWKFKTTFDQRYFVSAIYKATPALWVLEFAPKNKKIKHYAPGEYFFIRFKNGDITKEAHPFSTSSAITKTHKDSIEFMIKEAGDWTKALANIKVGDIATLEGPYGEFYSKELEASNKPFVLMGGGIGLTPNLSILRSEIDQGSQRNIILIWALSYEHDMFMIDELESYKKVNPNFSYHIIFSNEKVADFPFGFISTAYLKEVGVDKFFESATFFVCGPDVMMNATKKVLLSNNVPEDNVRVDEFGF